MQNVVVLVCYVESILYYNFKWNFQCNTFFPNAFFNTLGRQLDQWSRSPIEGLSTAHINLVLAKVKFLRTSLVVGASEKYLYNLHSLNELQHFRQVRRRKSFPGLLTHFLFFHVNWLFVPGNTDCTASPLPHPMSNPQRSPASAEGSEPYGAGCSCSFRSGFIPLWTDGQWLTSTNGSR